MKHELRRALRFAKHIVQLLQSRANRKYTYATLALCIGLLVFGLYADDRYLIQKYSHLESPALLDRNGTLITLFPNEKGAYGRYEKSFSPRVLQLLIAKEDRFFYFHPGVNPISTLRAAGRFIIGRRPGGASTITQQLAKNILGNEMHRSLLNKIVETFGAFSLELFESKQTILTMYANSVYMGNQVQGLQAGSELYFRQKPEDLDETKLAMLLSTISSPSIQNPWREENARTSRNLALRLSIPFDPKLAVVTDQHAYSPPQNFELVSMGIDCAHTCTTTLDNDLISKLRIMLNTHVQNGWDAGARSGAIVVVKLPENEILAMIGTPDTKSLTDGQQINMTLTPRPIGSTAKPFIYLEGFIKGLRPYTLVDDREYKFPIGSGFPLYPKNYDGTYRGWITLHSALSNSLNVPTVKTLQYIGLSTFYDFLVRTLGFKPQRDLDEYQYGIALGALDMDPLTLAQYLTIFPKEGVLSPLRLFKSGAPSPYIKTPMSNVTFDSVVADRATTELVTRVLNDRLTGVQQFGLASSLNLPESNYAVKTGTSQNYHDSWTIGYTPDFLVVVWFGNPDNTALKHVTGQSGAGAIWHDTMQLLMNTEYNKKTPFDFSRVREIPIEGNIDYGLRDDVVAEHRNLLPDTDLITAPLDGDIFLSEPGTSIPLTAARDVSWYVNGSYLTRGSHFRFAPPEANDYVIKATDTHGVSQQVTVHVTLRR